MELIPNGIREQLLANGRAPGEQSLTPVVKLFTPDAGATWLLTLMEGDGDTLFGLCDLGLGCPELGYVSLRELQALRGAASLPVERDVNFKADKTLEEYARIASYSGRIVT